jgi:hypothetical protein
VPDSGDNVTCGFGVEDARPRSRSGAGSDTERSPLLSSSATADGVHVRRLPSTTLAVILLVVATGCSGASDQIRVPDVTGLNEAEAVQALEAAGLTAAAAVAEGSAERPGTVIEQVPEPGTRVGTGSTVTLSVAREGS